MARYAPLVADHDPACIDAALDRAAAALCARRGARLTRLRRPILELVWRGHSAVQAYELLGELGRDGGAAKPPTVYRALGFLIAHGLVHRLESLNACGGCPQPGAPHQGQFLICGSCRTVREFTAPAVQGAIAQEAAGLGFTVGQQTIEVHGVCQSCRPPPASDDD